MINEQYDIRIKVDDSALTKKIKSINKKKEEEYFII